MKSKYIGVYWSETSKKWYSKIRNHGEQLYLGLFDSELDAALAYDKKAYELRGDNTKFNLRNNEHKCEAPDCDHNAVTKYLNYWVCLKHKTQLKQHGKFLSRTIYNKNEIIVDGQYAYIVLYDKHSNEIGKTKIDAKNLKDVKEYKWYLRPDGYVATNNYQGQYTYLHCLICNKIDKQYIDHKDRNKLNNTEENLREASGSENQMNKGLRTNNTSGKVGVFWVKEKECWCAMICKEGKHINLGYFNSFDEAVKCRVDAEIKMFGTFRTINEKEIGSA